jgi:DNA mismatch endonuclease, patch repair protein
VTSSPSYKGLRPASPRATSAARGASKKKGTRCEALLRAELRRLGLRFGVNARALPGCPDIVFRRERLVIFCDGDFWHGRSLGSRIRKLERGHNPAYWVAKVKGNVARDRRHRLALRNSGWRVLRYWETEILKDAGVVAGRIRSQLSANREELQERGPHSAGLPKRGQSCSHSKVGATRRPRTQ